MNRQVQCFTDKETGECLDIVDAGARELIAEIERTLETLTGFEGGVASAEDVQELERQLTALETALNNLDNTYATDENITELRGKITALETALNNLDNTYAKDEDIQEQFTAIESAITFAESERQKSKNLFRTLSPAGASATKNGITLTVNADFSVILNGTCSITTYFDLFDIQKGANYTANNGLLLDPNKTYTYSFALLSGEYTHENATIPPFYVTFRNTNGASVNTEIVLDNRSSVVTKTFTGFEINNAFIRLAEGTTYNNCVVGLMICEGVETEYQEFNGDIVHEKKLEDILVNKADKDLSNVTAPIEKIETVYDMSSTDSTLNWGYTSGIQGAVSVSAKDFSKYKKLIYYCSRYGFVSYGIIDLEGVQRQEAYRSKSTQGDVESSTHYITTFTVSVNPEKTSFTVDSVYQNTGGKNNNTGYYIWKLEGIY